MTSLYAGLFSGSLFNRFALVLVDRALEPGNDFGLTPRARIASAETKEVCRR